MTILVTAGTGKLAQRLFVRPGAAGRSFRILSRKPAPPGTRHQWATGDLLTGAGLPEALRGVDTVLHMAHDPTNRTATDVEGTRNLVNAAAAAGVQHLLYLSIIGVDVIPYPYYQHKYAAEQIIERGSVRWSILRAAQFHTLLDWMFSGMNQVPLVLPVPTSAKIQPLDDDEMADRLLVALQEGPRGRLRDFAGPEILTFGAAVRPWKRYRRVRKLTVPVLFPGGLAQALRSGLNTAPDGDRGRITWPQWLERRYGAGA